MNECKNCTQDYECTNCKKKHCISCGYWIDGKAHCNYECVDVIITEAGKKIEMSPELKEDLVSSLPFPEEKFSDAGVRDSCSQCGHYLIENPMKEVVNTFKVSHSDTLGKNKIMTAVTITAPDTIKTLVVNSNPPSQYNEFPGIIFSVVDRNKRSSGCYDCKSERTASIHLNKATLIKLIIELSKML